MNNFKDEWLGNIKGDLLAGLVVCMALIPEVIGFTIVAGVEPMIGIYTTFCFAIITSIFGGRTGMISAAAGSMAFVLAHLVREYGVQYMLIATILTGIFQIILGYLKVGKLLRFIPEPVMIGFVNALGILMFKAQIKHFEGSIILPILGIISITIIYLLPKLTKTIPSPIIAIIVISIIVFIFNIDINTLGDMGEITTKLPIFSIPDAIVRFEVSREYSFHGFSSFGV